MTTTREASPMPSTIDPPAGPARLAATLGLAGAGLSLVSWAFALADSATGTGLWRLGSTIGELAGLGMIALVLGMFAVRETGPGATGRTFLLLWVLGDALIAVAGAQMIVTGKTDSILFPIGLLTAGLAALVASIFIACNKRLRGSLRRWAPLIFSVGSFAAALFEGDQHTLQVNLADLANSLLQMLLAVAFYVGVRKATSPRH